MASSSDSPSGTPPTYEAIQAAQQPIKLTPAAQRLHWTLTTPLSTAIHIMPDTTYNPNAQLEPYFSTAADTTTTPSAPSIAHAPLTDPKISSVTVRVEQLENWEETWLDFHGDHGEPGPHNEEEEDEEDDEEERNMVFGQLVDYDPDEDEEPDEEYGTHLLRCCGGDRPRKKKVSLTVTGTGCEGGFVTVHDFVTAVHPWLMRLRGEILVAGGDLQDHIPLGEETRLMVVWPGPDSVDVLPEEEWRRWRGQRPGVGTIAVGVDGGVVTTNG